MTCALNICNQWEKTKVKARESCWLNKNQTLLCLLIFFSFFNQKKGRKALERLILHVSMRNNGLIMWLVLCAGSCLVPVQHYSRKPAAGPSCDQCWTDSNDHPATGQGLCAGFSLLIYTIFSFCRFPTQVLECLTFLINQFGCRDAPQVLKTLEITE